LSLAILAALVTAFESLNFFFYFTVLSNILAAMLFAGLATRPDWMSTNGRFRGAVTLYMVITGLVYAVLLRPIAADVGLTDQWVNWVLHSLGPAAALIDWLLFPPERPLARNTLLAWLVFPAVYLAVSLIRGPIANWYPYPFLDPSAAGGYGAVALWSLLILLFFVGVGGFLRWWANARGTQPSDFNGVRASGPIA
jgi:hypothetical protein